MRNYFLNGVGVSNSLLGILLISLSFSTTACTAAKSFFAKLPDPNISFNQMPQYLRGNFQYNVAYQLTTSSSAPVIKTEMEFSQDGGKTFSTIASLPVNSTTFAWTTPGLQASNLMLRIAITTSADTTYMNSNLFGILSNTPQFVITSPATTPTVTKARAQALSGTCENAWTFQVSLTLTDPNNNNASVGNTTAQFPCTNGQWSYTTGLTASQDVVISYNIVYSDPVGNAGNASGSWASIQTPPKTVLFTVTPSPSGSPQSIVVNGSSVNSLTNFIPFSLQGKSPIAGIQSFCVKYSYTGAPTQPVLTDSCWVSANRSDLQVTADSTNKLFKLTTDTLRIGFTPNVYTMYVWWQDTLGNISTPSQDALAQLAINYNPLIPPQISNLSASAAANQVTVQWKIIDPNLPGFSSLGVNPVSLYYTTDDQTYTSIAGASSLSITNSGCSLNTALYGGCFVWSSGAPTSGYYRIRITVTNIDGQTTVASTNSLGSPNLALIAGNTDPGLGNLAGGNTPTWGSSGASSMFFNNLSAIDTSDPGTVVVADDGTLFFRDIYRGILIVSPLDGMQRLFLALNATSTVKTRGDGGNVSQAWVKAPAKIALDWNNGLIIYDYDRIRRVDLTTNIITTLVGGGTTNLAGTAATSFQVGATAIYNPNLLLSPLPNGDVYFQQGAMPGPVPVYYLHQGIVNSYAPSPTQVTPTQFTTSSAGINKAIVASLCSAPFNTTNNGCYSGISSTIFESQGFRVGWGYNSKGTAALQSLAVAVGFDDPGYISYVTELSTSSTSPQAEIFSSIAYSDPISTTYASAEYSYTTTGRDGLIYLIDRPGARIYQMTPTTPGVYNPQDITSYSWTLIAGTGVMGTCPDHTPATQCTIDPQDLFVSTSGDIYIMDRGRIRTITNENGSNNLVTVYGQPFFYGDGGLASSARFNSVQIIDESINSSGITDVVLLDRIEARMRDFTLPTEGTAGLIETTAGNGSVGTSSLTIAANSPSQALDLNNGGTYSDDFSIDPATGNIYYRRMAGQYLSRINRTTGFWEDIVGGGTTAYMSADNLAGNKINLTSTGQSGVSAYFPNVLGFGENSIIVASTAHTITEAVDAVLKTYDVTTPIQIPLAGNTADEGSAICPAGTSLASGGTACSLPNAVYFLPSKFLPASAGQTGSWLLATSGSKQIFQLTPGGSVASFATTQNAITSFAYRTNFAGSQTVLYYCSAGVIHSKNLTTGAAEVALPWAIPSMACSGRSMLYNSERNSLIFPISQTFMMGIAEYQLGTQY